MSPLADGELTTYQLAKALGLDRRLIARDIKRGMPRTVEGAKAWRLAFVQYRRGHDASRSAAGAEPAQESVPKVVPIDFVTGADPGKEEDLSASLERLRRLEKGTAAAIERLLKENRAAEAIALRREHGHLLRSLFDASAKLLKLEESSGKVIGVDKALALINNSMQSGLLVLRRLPELARSPEERGRLEAFLCSVLNEFRAGAAASAHLADGEAAKESV